MIKALALSALTGSDSGEARHSSGTHFPSFYFAVAVSRNVVPT